MIHPIKRPTRVDATKCPITRFREPDCHSCFTSVHVIISGVFLVGCLLGPRSGFSVYEKAALGSMWCTAGCVLGEDMACDSDSEMQASEEYLVGLIGENARLRLHVVPRRWRRRAYGQAATTNQYSLHVCPVLGEGGLSSWWR